MSKVSAVQKRLNREHHRLGTWRAVAELYSDENFTVNVAYVHGLAVDGVEPSAAKDEGQEVRYRLGLDRRPKVRGEKVMRVCPCCGKPVAVTADGVLRRHVRADAPACEGSFTSRHDADEVQEPVHPQMNADKSGLEQEQNKKQKAR